MISNETGQKLEISFDFHYGFRSFDESFRLKLWEKNNGLFKSWSFYYTKKSEFIDWFNSETSEIYVQNLMHFMIGAGDEIIDVISNQYPTCNWLK